MAHAQQQHTTGANVHFFANTHAARATEVANHTHAVNALSMAQWHLTKDTGSLRQALAKVEAARTAILKLISLEGGAA